MQNPHININAISRTSRSPHGGPQKIQKIHWEILNPKLIFGVGNRGENNVKAMHFASPKKKKVKTPLSKTSQKKHPLTTIEFSLLGKRPRFINSTDRERRDNITKRVDTWMPKQKIHNPLDNNY